MRVLDPAAIIQLRTILVHSQDELASFLSVTRNTVSRWECTRMMHKPQIENHLTLFARSRGLEPVVNGDVTVGYRRAENKTGAG